VKRGRSYWKIVREARDRYDLSLPQARAYWRELRDYTETKQGRRPYATDLARHPKVAKRLAHEVVALRADVFDRPAVPKPVPRERDITPAPVAPPAPKRKPEREEWHVSIAYDGKGGVMDIGVSVIAPAGANAEQVRGAVWRALLGHDLTAFKIAGVDWRKERKDKTGRVDVTEKEYAAKDLPSFKSLAHAAKWRVQMIEG
jgi:hypothetical protein